MKKTILKLNASALRSSGCNLKLKRIVIDGYKQKIPYVDIRYGTAFHLFQKVIYESKGDFSNAVQASQAEFSKPWIPREGKRNFLTETHLLKTCVDYWNEFGNKDSFQILSNEEGKPMVEVNFAISVYSDDNLEIWLVGTIDKIGKFINGCYAIGDYKTHSLWSIQQKIKTEGKTNDFWKLEVKQYFKQFELSLQLRFYIYILRLASKLQPNTAFGKVFGNNVGAFIDGIFTSGPETTKFIRSDIFFFKDKDLDEMNLLVEEKVKTLRALFYNKEYSIRDGLISGFCTDQKYPCIFANVCAAPDDIARKFLLRDNFEQVEYDPLKFSKGEL